MLEDMKNEIHHSLAMQMDTMQLKMKREEAKKGLAIIFPKCRKKHENNEYPLDRVKIYGIYSNKHATDR